jgi:hypothetical protein
MRRIVLAICALAVSALSCTQAVQPLPTSTPAPTDTASPVLLPTLTARPSFTPAADTSVIVQAVVTVRDAPDGIPTGDYLNAGETVEVSQCDGDWCEIASPVTGWVWIGCIEDMSDKLCEAR